MKSQLGAKDAAAVKAHQSKQGPVNFALGCATEMVGGVVVGAVVGYYLGHYFAYQPLFIFAGIVLGSAAGFRNMLRYTRRSAQQNDKKKG